ncbi:MAG: hypothetical protein U0800_22535 [Isosphaeraceae bacterium]
MVPDVDSIEALDFEKLKARWKDDFDRHASFYQFDDGQKTKAEDSLKAALDRAEAWYNERDNSEKLAKYREDIAAINAREEALPPLSYERERLTERRRGSKAPAANSWPPSRAGPRDCRPTGRSSRPLSKPKGAMARSLTDIDMVNKTTMCSLILCGRRPDPGPVHPPVGPGRRPAGDVLPQHAPGRACPGRRMAEGHYMIVNKNLVEFLACLFLAFTPSGQWIGLDSLLFGWIGRGRAQARAEAEAEAEARAEARAAAEGERYPSRSRPR